MEGSQHVVVVGAGLHGLSTAILLARDGHRVTVLERDPAVPLEPAAAWEAWDRRGCSQFRLPHYLLPRFRQLLEAQLPDVAAALAAAGATRYDVIDRLPAAVSGGRRDGDDRYVALTARRPVLEAVLAQAAAAEPGVEVRRGTTVRGLLTGRPDLPDVPHVAGVLTGDGAEVRADLVVDAAGRRSPLPALLTAAGAAAVPEEREDCGFVYYARHFRAEGFSAEGFSAGGFSAGGGIPSLRGPLQQQYDSVSLLTLPADNGTWSVVVTTSARDRELRRLREVAAWDAAVRCFPLVAEWVDAEPITGVDVMAGIEDRIRRPLGGGVPVATGLVPVGDAWACTNPSLGRGGSMGLLHAVVLRDLLRTGAGERPGEQVLRFAARTGEELEPWYRATVAVDRGRLAEIEGDRTGVPPAPGDPRSAVTKAAVTKALAAGAGRDPDVLRALLEIASMLTLPADVLAAAGTAERVMAAGAGAPRYPLPGPDRRGLLQAVSGVPAA